MMSRSSMIGLMFLLALCPLLVSSALDFNTELVADLELDEHDVQDLEDWVPDAENACNSTHSLSDSMIPAKWNPRVVTYFHHINCSQLNGTEEHVQKVPPAQFIGGVLLALFGSTGESLGFTLMKLAHDNAHLKAVANSEPERFYLYNGAWWMGFVVFFIGNIMDFAAFGLAGQAITILVGCWTLCVNLYTAPKILGEKRKLVDLIGAVIIMTGIGMAVAANPKKDRSWTTSELVERYTDSVVIILLGVVSSLVFVTYAITRIYHSKYPLGALMSEDAKAKAKNEQLGIDEKVVTPQIPYNIRICHVLLAAMVGTITVCCAKAASEMLIATLTGNDEFTGWGMLIVAVFLISLPAQLHFVNVSLMVNDALFHIPVFYVFWQVGATITGGVLYEEFASYKTWQLVLYGTGVLFLLLGIKVSSGRLAELETGMNAPAVVPVTTTATITKTTTTTTTTFIAIFNWK
eukprot:m.137489 g.137489  ORF g.137489 m.137489 type:complete len:463 (-) comp29922_c1_seq1:95-1483(-)